MKNAMLADFLGGSALAQLSKKYDIGIPRIRELLVKRFGQQKYLQTCRANGGRAVAKKLKNGRYRAKYAANMSISVKRKLSALMQRKKFRRAWIEKASAGSKRGAEALMGLMKDAAFRQSWVEKCKRGGSTSLKNMAGFHSAHRNMRKKWSIAGLKRTGRKFNGPKGERMYNPLEVSVSRLLKEQGVSYAYEKIVRAHNKNGFISLDFELPQDLFIEATYWDKIQEKAAQLNAKYKLLRRARPKARLIVVTRPEYEKKYRKALERHIKLHTLETLRHFISGG